MVARWGCVTDPDEVLFAPGLTLFTGENDGGLALKMP